MNLAQKDTHEQKKVIVYYRVSSANQKDDLKSQKQALETFCAARVPGASTNGFTILVAV